MARSNPLSPHRWGGWLALVLAWPLAGAFQPSQAATSFSYISSPYSWVGLGEAVTVREEDGFAFTASPSSIGLSFAINDFDSNPDPWSARWWTLDLYAAADQPLSIGSYTGAVRFPFNEPGTPGLSFTGNGRGNNTLTGSFQVLDATVADDGTLLSFAADFVQYDEGWQNWWNKGSIRFNSDLPILLTPEPINMEELIALGYLPDPDLQIPEEPVGTEPPGDFAPIVIEDLEGVEEPGGGIGGPILDITLEEPLLVMDADMSDIVWHFSSGSSATMVLGAALTPSSIFLPAGSPQAAPGPLPVAAALAGWHGSRRLRRRCKARPISRRSP